MDIKTFPAYVSHLQSIGSNRQDNPDILLNSLIQRYNNLISYYLFQNFQGAFIKDPSQRDQIVSEGQSYWQILSTDMARLDPDNSSRYQDNFDRLLQGTEYMVTLARIDGNRGDFPAWKVKISDNQIILDSDNYGPTSNSAADADLDLIRSLIYADKLVRNGLWQDRGYSNKALALIRSASEALFREENGFLVMKPSEDWDSFHFSDYLTPASCMEISNFIQIATNHRDTAGADFWHRAALDSIQLYQEIFKDTGTFPANVEFRINSDRSVNVNVVGNSVMTYDGIRAPWEIGRYILAFQEDQQTIDFANNVVEYGLDRGFSHTHNKQLDMAMYLPLALSTANKAAINFIESRINSQINQSKYYENTMYLLGMIDAYFPREIDISTTPPANISFDLPITNNESARPQVFSGEAIQLNESVSSGWGKAITYQVDNNSLTIISRTNDADSLYLGKINTNGADKLVVTVRESNGVYWDCIGVALSENEYDSWQIANKEIFPAPLNGGYIADNFIKGPAGKVEAGSFWEYDVSAYDSFYLGLKIYAKKGQQTRLSFNLK